jgi:hypothetical protein
MMVPALWLAAIGRALQQPMVGEPSCRLAKPQDEAGHGAAPSVPVTPERTPAVA